MSIASPTPPPDLRAVLDTFTAEIMAKFNCHEIGTIVAFDATSQTAQVQIGVLRQQAGKQVPYPLLTNCPVFILSGGSASLRMPIASGDTCLVHFNDRDLDNWFSTGNVVAPNSVRMHDLSDGCAEVGFRTLANKIAGYATDEAGLYWGAYQIRIKSDGSILLVGKNGTIISITSAGRVAITDASGAAITSSSGGKWSIANSSGSLGAALDLLFTALTSWADTHGDTPNPATLAAITAAKTATDAIIT